MHITLLLTHTQRESERERQSETTQRKRAAKRSWRKMLLLEARTSTNCQDKSSTPSYAASCFVGHSVVHHNNSNENNNNENFSSNYCPCIIFIIAATAAAAVASVGCEAELISAP